MKKNKIFGWVLAASSVCLAREPGRFLTQEHAAFRASVVSNVEYKLSFILDETGTDFSGRARIHFDLKKKTSDLTLDFLDGNIKSMTVNGEKETPTYKGQFIELPNEHLKVGKNQISIEYTHAYSKTGAGLYRYKDPVDNATYIYTDFEPYNANEVFPCFDQPDLKATYFVEADVPAKWQVVSTVRENFIQKEGKKRKTWFFPKSKPFSTYIFALHAGDYHVWEDKNFRYPLRLFARKSLAQFVKPEFWFDVSKKGFNFFETFFGTPYPFEKYDQLIVPDFNAGAMENVAAVTFSERFIKRGFQTRAEKLDLADVIMHEMSHMWFGNLVTMKWWDDVWLNETFATYMAALATFKTTEFKETWLDFFTGTKQWAYKEDDQVISHPVVSEIKNTQDAFSNFGGIVYGKGASLMKQLAYQIGEENFSKGLKYYFANFSYQNTTLNDFISSLEKFSTENLKTWMQAWLQSAGHNTVEALWSCEQTQLKSLEIVQSKGSVSQILRDTPMEVAFYKAKQGKVVLDQTLQINVKGEKTLIPVNASCPDMVLLNANDHAFVKTKLDAQSAIFGIGHMHAFEDELVRAMIWTNLWHEVLDQERDLTSFAILLKEAFEKEKNLYVLKRLQSFLFSSGHNPNLGVLLLLRQINPETYQKESLAYEKLFLKKLRQAPAGSELQRFWFGMYQGAGHSEKYQQTLKRFLVGVEKIPGLKIDQDDRWSLIRTLNFFKTPGAEVLITSELKKDPSSRAKHQALGANVLRANLQEKQNYFQEVLTNQNQTLADKKDIIHAFFPDLDLPLRKTFRKDFFDLVKKLSGSQEDEELLSRVAGAWVPVDCTPEASDELERYLKSNSGLQPILQKPLKVALQSNDRCVDIVKKAATHN